MFYLLRSWENLRAIPVLLLKTKVQCSSEIVSHYCVFNKVLSRPVSPQRIFPRE
uniref:Uncharacterized protein n=1 Tax=Anguilla anguilla TaxID=7936 RepID=A0A0E9U865_ANGAN